MKVFCRLFYTQYAKKIAVPQNVRLEASMSSLKENQFLCQFIVHFQKEENVKHKKYRHQIIGAPL